MLDPLRALPCSPVCSTSTLGTWHEGLYDDQPKSLKLTVESLGLVWQGTYHRGIDDARNVARIITEMLGLFSEPGQMARMSDSPVTWNHSLAMGKR
ncbi:hypothetical protein TMM008_40460 [Pseudomonas sp. 008]|nr:hypothetical protein TMM008_40460 [Pseudomonas sp. 008]